MTEWKDSVWTGKMPFTHAIGFFFKKKLHSTMHTLTTHAHSPLWIHVRKPYPYKHLRRTEPADHEIHEVTSGASMSTGMSPTTKSITPFNPGINLGKCEHLYQVEDLNPSGQVPPQGTQPADLWLVCSCYWILTVISTCFFKEVISKCCMRKYRCCVEYRVILRCCYPQYVSLPVYLASPSLALSGKAKQVLP
jgi:hypothetical protein